MFSIIFDGTHYIFEIENEFFTEKNKKFTFETFEDAENAFNTEIDGFDIVNISRKEAWADYYGYEYDKKRKKVVIPSEYDTVIYI